MTKFRLARISLILAALGLNAAPAILGASAHAAEKAAPAPEAPKDVVRPEMYKLIDPAQIKGRDLADIRPGGVSSSHGGRSSSRVLH